MKNVIKYCLLLCLSLYSLYGLGQCPAKPSGMVDGIFNLNALSGTGTGVTITGVDTTPITLCEGAALVALNTRPATQVGFKICYKHTDGSVDILQTPLNCTESSGVASADYTVGKYAVIVTGTANAQNFYACKVVNIVKVAPPVFSLTACRQGVLGVTIPADPNNNFTSYTIDWGPILPAPRIIFSGGTAPRFSTKQGIPATITNSGNIIVSGNMTIGNANHPKCSVAAPAQSVNLGTTIPPSISLLEIQDDKTVAITYRSQQNTAAEAVTVTGTGTNKVYTGTGTKITPTTSVITSVLPVTGLNTLQPLTFNMQVLPNVFCTNVTTGDIDVPLTLLKVDAQNKRNVLTWQTVTGAIRYEVWRGVGTVAPTLLANVSNATLTYTDQAITCALDYTYYVRAVLTNPGPPPSPVYSVSKKITVKAINTDKATALADVFVSVESGENTLQWLKPTNFDTDAKFILVYRSDGDPAGPYNRIDSTQYRGVTKYVDATAEPDKMYCYKLAFYDKCGNSSYLSKALCPMQLTVKGDALNWTPYIQFSSGTREYQVKKKYIDTNGNQSTRNYPVGNSLGWKIDENDPTDDSQQVLFYIEANSNPINGNTYTTKSNEVLYTKNAKLFLPEVFTPNNDNANDSFTIKGLYLASLQGAYIFDRWGNTIFYTTNMSDTWNGIIQATNTPAPEGTYTYKIVVKDQVGNILTKEGSLLLVR